MGDVGAQVVFSPSLPWDPEAYLVVVLVWAWLLVILGGDSDSSVIGVVMPISSCVCVEDV